jgi:hypothetical protein
MMLGHMNVKFCMAGPNMCGFSVCSLRHVTVVASTILRLLLDFLKICALHLLTKENMWTSDGLRDEGVDSL